MTTNQKREYVRKALRNVRRAHRTFQTEAEVLERILDRLIKRKTLVVREQLAPIVTSQTALQNKFRAVEAQITALLEVSSM